MPPQGWLSTVSQLLNPAESSSIHSWALANDWITRWQICIYSDSCLSLDFPVSKNRVRAGDCKSELVDYFERKLSIEQFVVHRGARIPELCEKVVVLAEAKKQLALKPRISVLGCAANDYFNENCTFRKLTDDQVETIHKHLQQTISSLRAVSDIVIVLLFSPKGYEIARKTVRLRR